MLAVVAAGEVVIDLRQTPVTSFETQITAVALGGEVCSPWLLTVQAEGCNAAASDLITGLAVAALAAASAGRPPERARAGQLTALMPVMPARRVPERDPRLAARLRRGRRADRLPRRMPEALVPGRAG